MTDTFTLADRAVRRLGYGAMQLCGLGVIGPPRHRDEAIQVLEEALARYEQKGNVVMTDATRSLLGELKAS